MIIKYDENIVGSFLGTERSLQSSSTRWEVNVFRV